MLEQMVNRELKPPMTSAAPALSLIKRSTDMSFKGLAYHG